MKLFYIDLETTGLDSNKHGIIQISVLIESQGRIEEKIDWHVAPFPDDEINDRAYPY